MRQMNYEECERFIIENGLRKNWNYSDFPDKMIPIHEFYLKQKKDVYEMLLYCPNFVMSRTRNRHGILVKGWFDTNKPLVGRIVYEKPLIIDEYYDKNKFFKKAGEIYLKELENVEFITFDDEITDELFNLLMQISNEPEI